MLFLRHRSSTRQARRPAGSARPPVLCGAEVGGSVWCSLLFIVRTGTWGTTTCLKLPGTDVPQTSHSQRPDLHCRLPEKPTVSLRNGICFSPVCPTRQVCQRSLFCSGSRKRERETRRFYCAATDGFAGWAAWWKALLGAHAVAPVPVTPSSWRPDLGCAGSWCANGIGVCRAERTAWFPKP